MEYYALWLCRGACDVLERAFNYAWTQAGLSLDVPANPAPPTVHQQQRRVRDTYPCMWSRP